MKIKYLFIAFLPFLLLSCGATGKFYASKNSLDKNFKFQTFDVKVTSQFKNNGDYVYIVNSLKEAIKYELLKEGYTESITSPDIIIKSNVTYTNEGNAALRYFIGLGAGKGEVKATIEVLNSNKVQVVNGYAKGVVIGGSFSSDSFGGDTKDICKKIAKDFVRKLSSKDFR